MQVKIDWRTPTEEDPQKQAEAIEQPVNIGASGIAVSCSDANKLTPAIDEAVARGVPVVTLRQPVSDLLSLEWTTWNAAGTFAALSRKS